MLKIWNVLLVIGAFCLSLFGTFLTRSGVLNSIHSFTESSIGPWFLGFIALIIAASVTVVLTHLDLLRARTRLESVVSREATFLYNNLLLVALCLTILWGVIYPLVSEAVRGETVTVGPPYYNFFLRVFGLPLLLLMGIGPLVAWRRASLRSLGRTFAWPAGVALATGAVLLVLGAGSSIPGLVGYTFSAFVLASIVLEFARGTNARRATADEGWAKAFSSLIGRNRRRYGGYVVHAAIVLLAIGVIGSSAYDTKREALLLKPGDSMTAAGYTLTYAGTAFRRGQNADEGRALIKVTRGGDDLGILRPGRNRYRAEQQTSREVAIRSDWLTGEDLFLNADDFPKGGGVRLEASVKPLVNLIWLAGLVFLLGAFITMWPDAREQRRLELRYGDQPVAVRA